MGVIHIKSNTIGDMTGTVTVPTSNGATTTVAATDLVRPSDWNSNHSQVITLGGNTSVQSTAGGTDLQIFGSGNITVAGSTGSLVISGPAVATLSGTVIVPYDNKVPNGSATWVLGQNSVHLFPCAVESFISLEHIRVPVSFAMSSAATASAQKGLTMDVAIYTRHTASATVLTRHYSTSYTIAASINSAASMMVSYITAIQNSTSYRSESSSSAGTAISSLLQGNRELILPLSTLLSPGEYWWAMRVSTSSVGGSTVFNVSHHGGVAMNTFNRVGIATNSSNSAFFAQNAGMGVYTTTTGAMPAGITITNGIHNNGSQGLIFLAQGTV